MIAKIFVYALLILQSSACFSYAYQKDVRKSLYWAFAVGITIVVTF